MINSGTTLAQSGIEFDATETGIRRLEAEQVDYLISGKVTELRKKWASDFTFNNPFNAVQDKIPPESTLSESDALYWQKPGEHYLLWIKGR